MRARPNLVKNDMVVEKIARLNKLYQRERDRHREKIRRIEREEKKKRKDALFRRPQLSSKQEERKSSNKPRTPLPPSFSNGISQPRAATFSLVSPYLHTAFSKTCPNRRCADENHRMALVRVRRQTGSGATSTQQASQRSIVHAEG